MIRRGTTLKAEMITIDFSLIATVTTGIGTDVKTDIVDPH